MSYAWILDRDHLAEQDSSAGDVGLSGPRAAPDWMISALKNKQYAEAIRYTDPPFGIFVFEMFDDDGIRYYTGRMITDEGQTEDACYGPLRDYGTPGAGAVRIDYPGHPEMDCG